MILVLASQLPEHPGLAESLRFQFVGFMIVMLVLSTLWLLIQCVGAIFQKTASRVKAIPSKKSAPAMSNAGSTPPEVVAAIAAAVHVVVGASHRIVSVRPVVVATQSALNINAWSVEGRRQIFSSHSFR